MLLGEERKKIIDLLKTFGDECWYGGSYCEKYNEFNTLQLQKIAEIERDLINIYKDLMNTIEGLKQTNSSPVPSHCKNIDEICEQYVSCGEPCDKPCIKCAVWKGYGSVHKYKGE